jgi:SM-20-related protein
MARINLPCMLTRTTLPYRQNMVVDLKRFEETPLTREPFEFLVVQEFIPAAACEAINRDYPKLSKPGSFPLSEVTFGPAFKQLVDALNSDAMRKAFEAKFHIDLTDRPPMITVRGRCSEKDGKIHTDSKTKIITVLIYLNPKWEQSGGRLRLLRSENDLDDVILEVPPVEGTLLAFKRADNSWHGHKPFAGDRRVLQFNWVTSDEVVRREQNRHRFSAFFKNLVGGAKAH